MAVANKKLTFKGAYLSALNVLEAFSWPLFACGALNLGLALARPRPFPPFPWSSWPAGTRDNASQFEQSF
jgi:hypothetical protein